MKYTLCKEESYKTSDWMGGTTKELAIFPQSSSYLNRDFVWRLSSAVIDAEEANFSKLPDYDRVLMVLEGEVVLSYEGERVARLAKLEQDRFDGAWQTKSFGKITDYNLMVRKGNEGYLDIIFPKKEKQTYEADEKNTKPLVTVGLFCKDGYGVVTFDDQSQMIKAGELLTLEYEAGESPRYSVMGEGTIIRSQVFYGDMEEQLGPEIIPEERATFDDFKKCVYLANIQFRWAKYIVKSLKTTWFDEALSRAIRKIERFYLPFLIFIIGVVGIGLVWAQVGLSDGVLLSLLLGWLILDSLIVSPLLYMVVVPKPVRKHIKNIDDLTPYEQKIRENELSYDERTERVLKKYKNSGKTNINE